MVVNDHRAHSSLTSDELGVESSSLDPGGGTDGSREPASGIWESSVQYRVPGFMQFIRNPSCMHPALVMMVLSLTRPLFLAGEEQGIHTFIISAAKPRADSVCPAKIKWIRCRGRRRSVHQIERVVTIGKLTRCHPPSMTMSLPLQYPPAGVASIMTTPAISSQRPARLLSVPVTLLMLHCRGRTPWG